jgi:SAM-dependent methyltransferase
MDTGGYFDGGEYESFGLHPFLSPARLSLYASLYGRTGPRLSEPFRYCELGCGQAQTLLMNAALFPHAQFVGVDFSEQAIERARSIAGAMGLCNIEFFCGDFAAFNATRPPAFDFIVTHGVWTWVGRETQQAILECVRDRLAPAGVACVSANMLAGWHRAMPLQHYLLCATSAAPAADRPRLAKELLAQIIEREREQNIQTSAAGSLATTLRRLPSYFSHEYLVPAWQPTTLLELSARFQSMGVERMGSAKAEFALPEFWVPKWAEHLVPADTGLIERESALDPVLSTSFRVELFGSGSVPVDDVQKREVLGALRLHVIHQAQIRETVERLLKLLGYSSPALRDALLSLLANGGAACADLLGLPFDTPQVADSALRLVAALLAGGVCDLTPSIDMTSEQSRQLTALNRARIELAADGHELSAIASPRLGATLGVDAVDMAHLIVATLGGSVIDQAIAQLKRSEAKGLVNGTVTDDHEAVMKRMATRACAIWPQTRGTRLQAYGIG